ncbi:hypothetical protein KC19_11G060300 [Ceratodon purpureus]|uniref:Secreted protein n=1 Tax=Ceratodon purpureus TaxID=3225 RepID=A0A8T0GBX5_CERPU|nr:hypothetical protein KC19_11G060300 [Ceratodon purpureus]
MAFLNAKFAVFIVVLVALVQLHECGRAPCVSTGDATAVDFDGGDVPQSMECTEKVTVDVGAGELGAKPARLLRGERMLRRWAQSPPPMNPYRPGSNSDDP